MEEKNTVIIATNKTALGEAGSDFLVVLIGLLQWISAGSPTLKWSE